MTLLILAAGFAASAALINGPAKRSQPIEVGEVSWGRDFEAALAEAGRTRKPVFLLFQEVPGCSGCKKFGADVLSHPLLVEAIEDAFVPMLVHNNTGGGADAKVLNRYREQALNFQVVRFVDSRGDDLIPRKDRVWSFVALAGRMVEALEASRREIPAYLRALALPEKQAEVAFATHCFWIGECELGKIDGVVSTEAGWLDGREVTLVRYLPNELAPDELEQRAAAMNCADKIYRDPGNRYKPAKDSDQARQLQGLPLKSISGLTELQLTKLNAFLRSDPDKAQAWLSPRQRAILATSLKRRD